jgi:hypothetical protein
MQSVFAAVLLFLTTIFGGHHTVTVHVAPNQAHTTSTSATAAVFNAAVAGSQTPAAAVASTPPHQPRAVTQASAPSPVQDPITPAPTAVLAASLPAAGFVTQDELAAQLQIAENNLRSLIYANTNGGAVSQVGEGQYASGGIINEIAAINKIDQLNGTTLNNVTVNGISGITASSLPPIDLTSRVTGILPIGSGGTGTSTAPGPNKLLLSDSNGNWGYAATSSLGMSGSGVSLTGTAGEVTYFNGTNAAVGTTSLFISTTGSVGIGTTSPTALLTIDAPSVNGSILRLSNASTGGHVFDLLSTGSGNTGGAGRLDIFDRTSGLARLSIASNGNVGVGTTSPFTTLSVLETAS